MGCGKWWNERSVPLDMGTSVEFYFSGDGNKIVAYVCIV